MKKLRQVGIVVTSIILAFAIFIIVTSAFKGVIYQDFLTNAKEVLLIPGLELDYSPQGLAYSEENDLYLFSGYMTDGTNSLIFLKDKKGNIKKMPIYNSDLSDFKGHVGGISVYLNNVWLADGGKLYRLLLDDLLDNDKAIIVDSFETNTEASFTFAKDGMLYVGEFYQKGKYETDESHHLLNDDGEKTCAIVAAYTISSDSNCGILSDVPNYLFTIPNEVQGFAITDSNCIVLSISYGIKSSKIIVYNDVTKDHFDGNLMIENNEIPLYHLNTSNIKMEIKALPMSEDLEYHEGHLLINFESACKKYSLFNIFPTSYVLSYPIE